MSAAELEIPLGPSDGKFRKTPKQRDHSRLMKRHEFVMAEGGARSGKTFNALRQQIVRGVKKPSRHLAARSHLNHARQALGLDTIPKVFRLCFPDLPYDHNKSDNVFYFGTMEGGQSELWLGGVMDNIDKVLGKEYSSIFLNECSLISFDAVETLTTRLAETSGLALKFFFDQNPTVKTWWTYRVFHQGMTPDREELDWDTAVIQMDPRDNLANLDPRYIKLLKNLPKRKRQRFWEGLYIEDVEGALWNDRMINLARLRKPGEVIETVIAVDPSVSHTVDSDECGIVVCSRDDEEGGIVHEDASAKMSVESWARVAVDLYHQYEANCIVAEVNQGGDLVESVIKNVDRTVVVNKVHASKSKYARAEPVSQLYEEEQMKISHVGEFYELEEELTTYVPRDAKHSPNRLDALVWGLTYLLGTESGGFDIAGF
jgi:pyruvoyl-dependent arginine decarboxylase (PvlArgDC)